MEGPGKGWGSKHEKRRKKKKNSLRKGPAEGGKIGKRGDCTTGYEARPRIAFDDTTGRVNKFQKSL